MQTTKTDTNLKIRLIRETPFYWIHKKIFSEYIDKIGVFGLALYNAYAFYCNNDTQSTYVSVRTLAKKLSISSKTVIRLNKILEKNNLISIDRKFGFSNVIFMNSLLTTRDSGKTVPGTPGKQGGDSGKTVPGTPGKRNNIDPKENELTREDASIFLKDLKKKIKIKSIV